MVRVTAGLFLGSLAMLTSLAAPVNWNVLSSRTGDFALPSTATQTVAITPADFDDDGTNDLVFAYSDKAPALVLMLGNSNRLTRPIEIGYLKVSGGGAAYDLDRDQDLDLVFGTADGAVYWWENPSPTFDSGTSWVRHEISGKTSNAVNGTLFAQITGGANHLVLAGGGTIAFAPIPSQIRENPNWTTNLIHDETSPFPAGPLHVADVDLDGLADLVAGNAWFKHKGAANFEQNVVAPPGTSLVPGRFKEGSIVQFVSWGRGKLRWHDCKLDPEKTQSWSSRDLLDGRFLSVHTGDIDLNGHDDIVAVSRVAGGWIFHADGDGNFHKSPLPLASQVSAVAVVDLNNDGTLDIAVSSIDEDGVPGVDLLLNQGGSQPRTRPYVTTD